MKCSIYKPPCKAAYDIYLFQDYPGEKYRVVKPMKFEFGEELGIYQNFPEEPTITVPYREWDELKKSFLENIIGLGLEPSAIEFKSKYEATKYHLEDFRKLIFEKDYLCQKKP